MKNKLIKNILILSSMLLSFNAFAETPKEKINLNNLYVSKSQSIAAQGIGNEILEESAKSKFLVTLFNGTEYAYTIKKLGSGDVKYIGNSNDINGLVFLEVVGYVDGRKLNSQLSIYRPSKYENSIYIEKFERNENKPYQFDLGIDSNNNLFIINNLNDVIYLKHSDKIKEPIKAREKYKNLVF